MARFTRMQVLHSMHELGMVPVFFTSEVDTAQQIVGACAQAGAFCVEMTNRGDHAIDIFCDLECYLKSKYPDVIFGAGSIIDAHTAALYIAHGANFIVGPVLDRETALICNKRKIPYLPGCGSVSEIHEAHSLGVEICKIFPAQAVGGPEFVKAVKGPCPWTSIMPTGCVLPTEESLRAWFKAGVSCVGMGSKLITKELVKNKDFTELKNRIKVTLELIKTIRNA